MNYLFDEPLEFISRFWPDVTLYTPQVEILHSLRDNDETVVRAGNMLGKDYITGMAVIWFFCSRTPCRIITTSVDGSQLEGVLWGEIRRFIQTAAMPLPILDNHMHLRKIKPDGTIEPRSEVIGRVAKRGEGFLGRHIESADGRPRTLMVGDEASGLENSAHEASDTWAQRKLWIGNPYPCLNFFKEAAKKGDIPDPNNPGRYYVRNIQIKGTDSPNVMLGLEQERRGLKPTHELLIPGLLSYRDYLKRRATWDKQRQTIGLDAEFYEGASVMLYPAEWLDRAHRLHKLRTDMKGGTRAMGVDTGEGEDKTVWTVVDKKGVVHQRAEPTPDTSVIPGITIGLMKEYGIEPGNVYFDRGGGGYQHVKVLQRMGYRVRHVMFNETASDPKRFQRMRTSLAKSAEAASRSTFKNRRAEIFGLVREMLDPACNPEGFAIPMELEELRNQLSVIPLWYDEEGKLELPKKRLRAGEKANADKPTLVELIGHSPDEADSLAMAVYALFTEGERFTVGRGKKSRRQVDLHNTNGRRPTQGSRRRSA